jgi:hypothetical protein
MLYSTGSCIHIYNFKYLPTLFPTTTVFYQVLCALLCIENDPEIFPAHYTWKVAEKGFKMAFMIKLPMIKILVKLFLKNK